MLKWDLSQPTRQSVMGVVVYILRNFRAMLSLLFTFIVIGAANPKVWLFIGIAIIPLSVVVAIFAYWQYRNFTFHLEGEELIIHKGVIFKERVVIPADRIQSIKIAENVVQRILGLVALKVDTAGSAKAELEIPALERKQALQLKELLYRKKEEAIAEQRSPEAAAVAELEAEVAEEKRVLVHLRILDLITVGLTENHLRSGFLALAVVFGYLSQYQQYLEDYIEEYVDEYASEIANAGITFALSALVMFIVISMALSMGRTVLRFFGLKAQLSRAALEIETGLLKRQYDRVPVRKVQFMEWGTNPLRRLVGFESAKVFPSNPQGAVNQNQRIEIPALRAVQSHQLAQGIFSNYETPVWGYAADAKAYVRIGLIVWSLLLAPAVLGLYWLLGWQALGLLAVLPVVAFFAWQNGRRVKLRFDRDYLMLTRGWVFPRRIVMPLHKMQSVSYSDNIFLRRRGLCHLHLYTAAGARQVRYMRVADVKPLYNYLVWCVEKSEEDWM